jgi:hypothetical protein
MMWLRRHQVYRWIVCGMLAAGLSATLPAADEFSDLDPSDLNLYANVADRLTREQINIVRFMELRACRERISPGQRIPVDRVVVRIPREAIDRFIADKIGDRDLLGDQARRDFLRRTPPEKLAFIAYQTFDSPDEEYYARNLDIRTDPEIIQVFKRNVMPVILTNCASSACHGNPNPEVTRLRLYRDPRRRDQTTYANYLTLREWMVDGQPLLNPAKPDESLLLHYMLPEDQTRFRHPGDRKFTPVFRNRRAPGYIRIEQWIGALRDLYSGRGYGFFILPPFIERPPADEPQAGS